MADVIVCPHPLSLQFLVLGELNIHRLTPGGGGEGRERCHNYVDLTTGLKAACMYPLLNSTPMKIYTRNVSTLWYICPPSPPSHHTSTYSPDGGRDRLVVPHNRHGSTFVNQLHERLLLLLHVQHIAHLPEGEAQHEDLVLCDVHGQVADVHHGGWVTVPNVHL